MMIEKREILIIHALDSTTEFLKIFQTEFKSYYMVIEPNETSIKNCLEKISEAVEDYIIIFLGHGCSSGLYSPESENFNKKIIIDKELGNSLFSNKKVLLLSCRSSEFIEQLNKYKEIVGFGNILSSMNEVRAEYDIFGNIHRDIKDEDINKFNEIYTTSIIKSLKLLFNDKILFSELSKYIEFYINKEINNILLDKNKKNRRELAKLLFEFKNEITQK